MELYTYKAFVTGVYDGDTITVNINLGFGVVLSKQRIRLRDVNAPEVRGKEKIKGKISRDWLRSQILNQDIILKTYKDKKGKYGRWIGLIFLASNPNSCINAKLIIEGYAKEAKY